MHEPFGAYPSPVQGCYRRRHDFFHRFHEESRTVEGNRAWLDRWVHGVPDWQGFLGAARRRRRWTRSASRARFPPNRSTTEPEP